MVSNDEDQLRLNIPIHEALAFALGQSDLGYAAPEDGMRQVVGVLVVDALEYSEQWSIAATARASLVARWPECFRS